MMSKGGQISKDGFAETTTDVLGHKIYSVRSERAAKPSSASGSIPIVMIHGAIVSRRYLMPTAVLLADRYFVYLPDLVGHGYSSKPDNALSVLQQAELIEAWLTATGITETYLLANSYGCEVIVEVALRCPQRIKGLILTSPAADPAAPTKFLQAIRLFRDGVGEYPTMILVLLKDVFDMGWKRAMQTTQIMIDYDYIPRLPLVTTRSLVVCGGRDPVAPRHWVEKVARLMPNSELVIIPDGPHNVNYTTPEELAAAVQKFIEDQAS